MALPEVERLSLQDIADRLHRSPELVEEYVRTFKFSHIILVDPGDARSLPFERHYYFDLPGSRAKALTSRNRKIYIDPKDCPEGFRWNKRLKIFIPRSAVEAFEREHRIGSYQKASQQDALSQAERLHNKEILTIPEAAIVSVRHQSTIRRWLDDGTLDSFGPKGKQRRIRRSDLLALINRPT